MIDGSAVSLYKTKETDENPNQNRRSDVTSEPNEGGSS